MKILSWMHTYIEKQSWDEDIKQDIYQKLLEMDEKEINEGYLLQMYMTKRNNVYNTETRRSELLEEHRDQVKRNLGMDGEHPDPEELVSAYDELVQGLDDLSPLLRYTLERVVVDGEDPETIAKEESVSLNTIYQRVWQAKQQLQGYNTND